MDRFCSATIGGVGSRVALTPGETLHMVTVRRVRPGGQVERFDGAGTEAVARLLSVERKRAVVEVLSLRGGGDALPLAARAYRAQFTGREVKVLAQPGGAEGRLSGYTDRYVKMAFDGPPGLAGSAVRVPALAESGAGLEGETVR